MRADKRDGTPQHIIVNGCAGVTHITYHGHCCLVVSPYELSPVSWKLPLVDLKDIR